MLQQQTVRSIQDVIKPRIPSPRASNAQSTQIVNPRSRSSRNVFSLKREPAQEQLAKADVNWNRLAYVQIVKSHQDVCSAVMLFGELVRTKSPGQRVLLVPESWFLDQKKGEEEQDPRIFTTRRLLRKAARKFRVTLVPMGMAKPGMKGTTGQVVGDQGANERTESDASAYSIINAFSLIDYDRTILLPSPGLFINASPMDAHLAFAEPDSSLTALAPVDKDADLLRTPLLIKPSRQEYSRLSAILKDAAKNLDDAALLKAAFGDAPIQSSLELASAAEHDAPFLSITTDSLTQYLPETKSTSAEIVTVQFNATSFMKEASLIRLYDSALPGPEFDVPYNIRAAVRPKNEGARRVWERTYENFRARRQDVCGLDLDPWHEGKQELK